jgi:hypothetical protein
MCKRFLMLQSLSGLFLDLTTPFSNQIRNKMGKEEWSLRGCYAMWLLYDPMFRRNLAPPSSG